MRLAIRKLKEDDERFGHKKGDLVVVNLDYDWDSAKVECLGKVQAWSGHSFYKSQLEKINYNELAEVEESEEVK